jgi:predicted aldo/keto reductase-like oxidoreductase
MKYRLLGKTSLKVSEIGLGTEHLVKQPVDIINQTLKTAIDVGMNYIDILLFYSSFLDVLGEIIEKNRRNLILACHIGAGMKDGKHKKLRSKNRAREAFKSVKSSLSVEAFDVAIIQYVGFKEYERIMAPRGLILYAKEIIETQQAKYLGISAHHPSTAFKAIESGEFDLIMTQFNLLALKNPQRMKLIDKCYESGIGLVIIKPFAGGLLLKGGKEVKVPGYKSGGLSEVHQIPDESTAVKNLAFILDTPGVSTVIPGVRSPDEINDNMTYYSSTPNVRDYKSLVEAFSS